MRVCVRARARVCGRVRACVRACVAAMFARSQTWNMGVGRTRVCSSERVYVYVCMRVYVYMYDSVHVSVRMVGSARECMWYACVFISA